MRTAVEINRPLHLLKVHAQVDRRHALRQRIENGIDAHVRQAAHHVVAGVRPALVLLDDRQAIGVVAVGAQPPRLVQRDAEIIAKLRTGDPLRMIFVIERRPVADEVRLREGGWRARDQQQNAEETGSVDSHGVFRCDISARRSEYTEKPAPVQRR